MKVATIIPSTGRPVELGRWVEHMARQTVRPITAVFAVASPADLPETDLKVDHITPVICKRTGSCHQRNVGLSAVLGSADVITFFDDDYVPSSRCLEGIRNLFDAHPDVVAANGTLLADGINSPGISYNEALDAIEAHDRAPPSPPRILGDLSGLYGCNMAFRATAIGDERFDERLPLYAWQEDIDFAARVGKRGRIVKTNAFHGVHQGVKRARASGMRFGYSQIANPLYLISKGTMGTREAIPLMIKNFIKNHSRALFPEPWIDRRGRCVGNWRALFDVLRRRDDPSNILRMGNDASRDGREDR